MKHRLLALCSAGLLALSMSMIAYPDVQAKADSYSYKSGINLFEVMQ